MIQKDEFIINEGSTFEDFINTEILKKAAIPEHYHRKIYGILKEYNIPCFENLPGEVQLQWLTGDVQYFNQHLNMIEVFGLVMVFSAGISGKPEALDWLVYHKLIQLPDCEDNHGYPGSESEYEIEDRLAILLLQSKNIAALEWGCNRNLVRTVIQTPLMILELHWREGFIWFNNRYPEVLFEKSSIPQWYPEKTFEIFENNEQAIRLLRSRQGFQFLTGNLEYYNKALNALNNIDSDEMDKKWVRKNMIVGGLLSGKMEIVEWLLEHQLLTPPANTPNTDSESDSEEIFSPLCEETTRAVVYSKNREVLIWLYEKNFLDNTLMICDCIMRAQWVDGFKWVADTFPEVLCRATVESHPSQFERKLYRPIHILAELDSCKLLEWCKQNKPFLLHQRDSEGNTMAHRAALIGNMKILRWFSENYSILLDCNDNDMEETIVHIGAMKGNRETVNIGIAHNKAFSARKNIYGVNMAGCALNSLNPVFFNEILSLYKNPHRIDLIYPVPAAAAMETLNKALDTNFRLQFLDKAPKVRDGIKSKLERNRTIYAMIILLSGFLDDKSSLYIMPIELLNLVCNKAISPYLPKDVSFDWKRNSFWRKELCQELESTHKQGLYA